MEREPVMLEEGNMTRHCDIFRTLPMRIIVQERPNVYLAEASLAVQGHLKAVPQD